MDTSFKEKFIDNFFDYFVVETDLWTLDVSWTASNEITIVPMKSLSSICLPVHLPVCPSLGLLKIGSLVSSGIVHADCWEWYLVTDEARFLGKNLGSVGLNQSQNKVFCHLIEFGSYIFLEIDSLRQCLTSSRGKTQNKNLGGPNLSQTGQNWARS